jgi:hypothetical protein
VGELLFVQDFRSPREAVLTNGAAIPIPARPPRNAAYDPGVTLGEIAGVMPTQLAFCDRRLTFESKHILDGRKLRACLVDRQRDGVFDTVYWAGASRAELFYAMFLMGDPDVPISVPYTLQEEETEPMLSAGAVVTKSMVGAYRLEFAVSGDGEPSVLPNLAFDKWSSSRAAGDAVLNAYAVHFRSEDVPLTLTLGGARVEITAVADDVVTYRIISGFDPGRSIRIGYTGALPRRSEH